MIIVTLILVFAVTCIVVLSLSRDPLKKFEPITDDELLLLACIDEEFYEDLLTYVRTLIMTARLQEYLSNKKELLEAISYFIMLNVATQEKEKKEDWERNKAEMSAPLSHTDKIILQRLSAIKELKK